MGRTRRCVSVRREQNSLFVKWGRKHFQKSQEYTVPYHLQLGTGPLQLCWCHVSHRPQRAPPWWRTLTSQPFCWMSHPEGSHSSTWGICLYLAQMQAILRFQTWKEKERSVPNGKMRTGYKLLSPHRSNQAKNHSFYHALENLPNTTNIR